MTSSYIGQRPLVLCGPSGSGKSTLLSRLMVDFPEVFGFSVSHTTRKPRAGEQNGRHYHFIERKVMEEAIRVGKFIENAEFSGNLYGTSKEAVDEVLKNGRICVLDIDIQGVEQVRKTDLRPWFVFLKPPSLDELANRLKARKTESEESLSLRLQTAAREIEYGSKPGNFDLVVVNDNLDHAYSQLKDFIEQQVLATKAAAGEPAVIE